MTDHYKDRRIIQLEAALIDAIDGLDEMLPYIDKYFQEKWDLGRYAIEARKVLKSMDRPIDQYPSDIDPGDIGTIPVTQRNQSKRVEEESERRRKMETSFDPADSQTGRPQTLLMLDKTEIESLLRGKRIGVVVPPLVDGHILFIQMTQYDHEQA